MALLTKLGLGFIGKMLIKIALAVLTALEVVIENIQNLLEGIVMYLILKTLIVLES